MKKILNYTLHDISIITPKGVVVIPRHGTARCSTTRKLLCYISCDDIKIPINETIFGDISGLPEPEENTIIIVSAITANVMRERGREDVYTVDEPVRDGNGKILGCRALSKITKYGS